MSKDAANTRSERFPPVPVSLLIKFRPKKRQRGALRRMTNVLVSERQIRCTVTYSSIAIPYAQEGFTAGNYAVAKEAPFGAFVLVSH